MAVLLADADRCSRSTWRCGPYAETNQLGYVSLPHHLTLDNFASAWNQSDMWRFFLNSVSSPCRR